MGSVAVRGGWGWGVRGPMGFSPEGVVEVGVQGVVGAVAAEHGHDVPPREAAAAPEGKDRRELCGQKEKFGGREFPEKSQRRESFKVPH